ncbi:MAG: hypothetical protein AB1491_10175 [Thermodesulfobacteriota bacterium]
MTEPRLESTAGVWLNPAMERLLSKITNLEETLEGIEALPPKPEQQHFLKICRTYLDKARNFLNRPLLRAKFPFFGSRHPHLVWELLHRVDEYFLLLITDEELQSAAIEVQSTFDLNIKEVKVREKWLGDKGKLNEVVERIKQKDYQDGDRYVLRDALKLVNEQMDRTFWQLSMNTLTSVWSGLILGVLVVLAALYYSKGALGSLNAGGLGQHFLTLFALGLMGAYLSNLMTKEDFLYIRGGPFWRYFLHNLVSKPLMSAFAAIFIYILERSKLVFSITSQPSGAQIININVSPEGAGYAYAVLAIVSGFAADKVMRNMIDGVLKRLEQKAEKAKDSEKK